MFNANSQALLSIPRPQKGLEPFKVDLALAYEGETRLAEVATADSGNALFLASKFARAYDALGRAYGALYKEVGSATIDSRKRRAIIILDLAPAQVKERGLAGPRSPNGSEDVREAICYKDEEYCAIEEYRAGLEAAKELVWLKLQAMRMGYEAVKAIVRGTSSSAGNAVHETGSRAAGSLLDRALESIEESQRQVEEDQQRTAQNAADEVTLHRLDAQEAQAAKAPRGFGKPSYR